MNVFVTAMSLISAINPNQTVTIIKRSSDFNEDTGVYETNEIETNATAQVQQQPTSVREQGDTATDSVRTWQLWFIDLTPDIVDALKDVDLGNTWVRLKSGVLLNLIEKEDYDYNGWITCKGVKRDE